MIICDPPKWLADSLHIAVKPLRRIKFVSCSTMHHKDRIFSTYIKDLPRLGRRLWFIDPHTYSEQHPADEVSLLVNVSRIYNQTQSCVCLLNAHIPRHDIRILNADQNRSNLLRRPAHTHTHTHVCIVVFRFMEVRFEGCLDVLMLCACCLLLCTLKHTYKQRKGPRILIMQGVKNSTRNYKEG